jgi:hypothetical protein
MGAADCRICSIVLSGSASRVFALSGGLLRYAASTGDGDGSKKASGGFE